MADRVARVEEGVKEPPYIVRNALELAVAAVEAIALLMPAITLVWPDANAPLAPPDWIKPLSVSPVVDVSTKFDSYARAVLAAFPERLILLVIPRKRFARAVASVMVWK